MEKKKTFFVSDEQIIDLVIQIPNLVLIISNTGSPRTPLLCPSVLVRLQFKFFILTFCPSLTTANSGLQKRQGAKNWFLAHVLHTVLYCTRTYWRRTKYGRGPRWPQVWHTDRHDKGALGLLVLNTLKLSSGFNFIEAHWLLSTAVLNIKGIELNWFA